ncbi:MAG: HD domain-containing protein [Coriobacteriia bacterium]
MVDGPLAGYLDDRAALIATVVPGTVAARALSDLTDKAVSALAEAAFASLGAPWAVVALGGYGARRLLPFSDLDLLVITDAPASQVRHPVERLLYPLWDASLEVGHAVRSRRDHRRACREDFETLTASLSGRVLAGDVTLALETLAAVSRDARGRSRTIARSLAARPRPGSPYDLWPDLKDGAGGQRDLDELDWRAALLGMPMPGDLDAARERITAARWGLHVAAGRKIASLTPDLEVPEGPALHEALATVHETLLVARGDLDADSLAGSPWDASALLRALGLGPDALSAVECAARRGALEYLVPGLASLMTLPRPALSHRFTVGAHTLLAAALIAGSRDTDRVARALAPGSGDARVLYAATLAHDAGKLTEGPGHSMRGVPVAETVATALGLDPDAARDAGRLVREHLLLAETAAYRDIDDEDVVLACAARIGRRDLVGPLYLLTLVDSLATGPGAWDDWHASLVRMLAGRVDAALAPEIDGAGMFTRAEEVRAAAAGLLTSAPAQVATVLAQAPLRYLSSRSPADVAADMNALAGLGPRDAAHPLDIRLQPGPTGDTYRVTIATYDRPGLFALVAGSLALSGLDILAAEANAGASGLVLDTFTVRSASRAAVEHTTWARLERTLTAALAGHLDIETRLAERKRAARPRSRVRNRVEVSTTDPMATVLTVRTADRPGLLYDIAHTIAGVGLAIVWAKASGADGVVTDVFRLLDGSGAPPRDSGELGHLSMRLRDILKAR